MSLLERVTEDLKTAMKGGDKPRVEVLRFVLSSLKSAEKEKSLKQPGATLADEDVITILQKETKRRKEALELFRQGGRTDLIEKEEADLKVIYAYLPQELGTAEIEKMVEELHAQGHKDFNSLMREVMKLVKGRADGKTVGAVIQKKLG